MTYEPVLMIWDFYDGARIGLAEHGDRPHYFKCLWDDQNNNYSERFELSPIGATFLNAATEQWKIYRKWELKFHTGIETLETHPGHRGTNQKYDELEEEVNWAIKKLVPLEDKFIPEFRALPNQDNLPTGILRELEVKWNVTS